MKKMAIDFVETSSSIFRANSLLKKMAIDFVETS